MKSRRWLEMAEYVSLFGSVVGSFAAVVSQQVIYASAPLSLSILLNLINRHRFEQQIQQRESTDIKLIHKDISQLRNQYASLVQSVASVNHRLDRLPAQTYEYEQETEEDDEKLLEPDEGIDDLLDTLLE